MTCGRTLFLLIGILLAGLILSPSSQAWDLPDRVWVQESMPPQYWSKASGHSQSGLYSVQRYQLYRPGGGDLNTFRLAVVWPEPDTDLFCVNVLPANANFHSGTNACRKTFTEKGVYFEIYSRLSESISSP